MARRHISQAYRNEILAGFSLGTHESTLYKVEKANFNELMGQVLEEYGLEERLRQAKLDHHKLLFIELGCYEGLFLHDLAALLEQRELLEAVDLNGVDADRAAIATAEEFARLATPPRPYLNFHLHKIGRPFMESSTLAVEGKLEFDFIMARCKVEYLPKARQRVEMFYHSLKPGGVIYLRCGVGNYACENSTRICVHPTLQPFYQFLDEYLTDLHQGVNVAYALVGWLEELGACQIYSKVDRVPVGGPTERGKAMLRNTLIFMETFAPQLIAAGRLSEQEYSQSRAQLFSELGPQLQGEVAYLDVLAGKPLSAN